MNSTRNCDFNRLLQRFYAINRHVKFGFTDAREAAEYMLTTCGPLWPGATIDRIDERRGYERGNLRYATLHEQLVNRRFRSRVITVRQS